MANVGNNSGNSTAGDNNPNSGGGGISADTGQVLALGTDNLPLYKLDVIENNLPTPTVVLSHGNHYKNTNLLGSNWTILDGTIDGQRVTIENIEGASGDLVLNYASFIDGEETITTLTIESGCVIELLRLPSVGFKVINKYPNSEEVDVLAINEYIHNLKDFHLVFSHENTPYTFTTRKNGIGNTYENLQGCTDNGNGSLTFGSGANGVYSKRANTVESITKVGDYFEIVAGRMQAFRTVWVAISDDVAITPENTLGYYRMSLASGGYSLRDKENNIISSAGLENGTYRFTRTLAGFKIEKNGVLLYESPVPCIDYSSLLPPVTIAETGYFKLGEFKPASPINTTRNAAGTDITTGLDFTQQSGMTLKVTVADQSTSIAWQSLDIDVDTMLINYTNTSALDAYGGVYDNDWIRINVVDPALGIINIVDQGRDFQFVKCALFAEIDNSNSAINPFEEIFFKSPNNTVWKLFIDNNGNLVTEIN